MLKITPWDIALVTVVTIQAAALSYMRQPRMKAFLLSLPVPFTLMVLAVNQPVDATNVMGLVLLLLFTHAVRIIHQNYQVPIIPAICLSALGYAVLGWLVAPLVPKTGVAFWLAVAFTISLGVYLFLRLPERTEREYRTQLPVWVKLPTILLVVALLVLVRNSLHGFATVFPLVGVIAAYESRFCLWTIGRQIPVIMVTLAALMGVVYLTQNLWGLPLALVAGWSVFLPLFAVITIQMWSTKKWKTEQTVNRI
jgi:uncharacterized membrane protein YidH (DUF202 family)